MPELCLAGTKIRNDQERSLTVTAYTIHTARQKDHATQVQPQTLNSSTGRKIAHGSYRECRPKNLSQVLYLFPSKKMSPEPEKSISREKKAQPGESWKTKEQHIVPKNRLSIVR